MNRDNHDLVLEAEGWKEAARKWRRRSLRWKKRCAVLEENLDSANERAARMAEMVNDLRARLADLEDASRRWLQESVSKTTW